MKKYLLIVLSFVLGQAILAQKTVLELNNASENTFGVRASAKRSESLVVSCSIGKVTLNGSGAKGTEFVTLESEGLMKTYNLGKPNIPVFTKLIEVPLEATVKFKVVGFDEEIIDLNASGVQQKIIPAQPSVSKSEEPKSFLYDEQIYSEDKYFNTEIANFENVGILRSARLGRIIINPIQYNPVKNQLRVLNNLTIQIQFEGADRAKTQALKSKYSSLVFDNVLRDHIQHSAIESPKLRNSTTTYAIVADRMFESTLAPFIAHKEQMGYTVIVGYTDDPKVGKTTTSIKAYFKGLYEQPATGLTPPQYALLVGDVAQVPSFRMNDHVSDLYYFDYTNDNIPDVFYGRFSAQNVAQLTPQIEKTLAYELGNLPDLTYLYEAVLVAGNDAAHELTFGNGQISYGEKEYFNLSNGITPHTYLQDEPQNGNYAARIQADINKGAGFVNYTAHCSEDGWVDPSFSVSDVSKLTNENKYGLWIGNCCRSNKFEVGECFGEAALRLNNKGAVGYIGGSDYTYWDEDFWWGVGFKAISATPSYDANHLGAYDRLFHTHGESPEDYYSTQGQLVIAGNLAVEESNSSRKLYYWEIYHLMGDPSLNVRFVPSGTCEANVAVTENISGGTSETLASSIITASNTIKDNANVHYGANGSVQLRPGFKVEKGTIFKANNKGCKSAKLRTIAEESLADNYTTKKSLVDPISEFENIKSGFNEYEIDIFPNPAFNGKFEIVVSEESEVPQSVVIMSSAGSMLYKNCNMDRTIMVDNLDFKGIVVVKVNFKNESVVKRIILQ